MISHEHPEDVFVEINETQTRQAYLEGGILTVGKVVWEETNSMFLNCDKCEYKEEITYADTEWM